MAPIHHSHRDWFRLPGENKRAWSGRLLRQWLRHGSISSTDLQRLARAIKVNWRTTKYALADIGAVAERGADGQWQWFLNQEGPAPAAGDTIGHVGSVPS